MWRLKGALLLLSAAARAASALAPLPAPSQLRVAVAGAGISGSLAARRLAEANATVTVFEAGRGPGGRMASRRVELDGGRTVYFDHGASYFSPKGAEFRAAVDEWVSDMCCFDMPLQWGVGGSVTSAHDARHALM